MNLDDLDYFKSVDPHNFLGQIDALPYQMVAAWAHGESLKLPDGFRGATNIVIAGRGDSAIAGDLAHVLALPESRLPLMLWTRGELPAFVSAQSLVIALSHSGNTAETVAVAEAARARGARVLTISSGGKLGSAEGATTWTYPTGGDSRAVIGHLSLLTLAAFEQLGLISDPSAAVAEAAAEVRKQQETLRAESVVIRNPAKRMAGQLMDRYAVLFVTDELAPVGRRWQGQINQLAKAWAQCIPLSDADHPVAGAMFPEALVGKYMTLFLQGSQPSAQLDALRMHFMTSGFNTDFIAGVGRSPLAQAFTLLHYGDYVAYYLAMCYGVDPTLTLR
ncbi:MAG: SIS domain-containing protein [Anaerolineales bacterium]